MATEVAERAEEDKEVLMNYPLVQRCDMPDEMRTDTIELCVAACEKHTNNYALAAQLIKDGMDKRFDPSWHAVVGEAFGFEATYETNTLIYLYFGGNLGVFVWKCS